MPSRKILKIESDMVRVISEIIFTEARDEILKSITITSARVSNDLSYAKIYFTSLMDMDRDKLVSEVNEAAPFIRGFLAEKLDLRHTPELEFIYDDSIEYANRIESIIASNHEE